MSKLPAKPLGSSAGRPPLDLTGAVWGRRRVLSVKPRVIDNEFNWEVECLCGRRTWMPAKIIARGMRTGTHGQCKHCAGRASHGTSKDRSLRDMTQQRDDLMILCERLTDAVVAYALAAPSHPSTQALLDCAAMTTERVRKMRSP